MNFTGLRIEDNYYACLLFYNLLTIDIKLLCLPSSFRNICSDGLNLLNFYVDEGARCH